MEEVFKYLREVHTFYIATCDGDQPRVRPFGALAIFEGRIYTQTGKIKNVYKQLKANPKVEICSMGKGGWLRIEATAIEDERREASTAVLDANPMLRKNYSEDDGNNTVFYFKDATATFYAFGKEPRVVKF